MSGDRVEESYYFTILNFSKDGIKNKLAADTGGHVRAGANTKETSEAGVSVTRGIREKLHQAVQGKQRIPRTSRFRQELERRRVQDRNIRMMDKGQEKEVLKQMLVMMSATFNIGRTVGEVDDEIEDNIVEYINSVAESGLVDFTGAKVLYDFAVNNRDPEESAQALLSHVIVNKEKEDKPFEAFSVTKEVMRQSMETGVVEAVENESMGIVQIIKKPHGNAIVEIYDTRGEVPDSLLDLLQKTVEVYYEDRT